MLTFLTISFIVFIISTLLAILHDTVFSKKSIKPIYILLTGIFLSIYCVLLYVDHKPEINGASSTGFLAFFHTIQIMLLGYDFEFIQETIKLSASPYAGIAFTYIALLFVLGPIYTFGFVLSFFENITSYIKCFVKRAQNLYVISDLNDKTLALANSIRQKDKKSLIIFSNVFSDINEKEYDFVSDVKSMKALAFKKDVCDFKFHFHSKNAKIVYFIMGNDESSNIEASLKIIDNFKSRLNTELYVLSTSGEGELLFDSIDDGIMKVRRINESRSFAYSTIYNNPITGQTKLVDNKKVISTLIVGFGGYGKELTKALLWCGQLPGYHTEINIIDKNPKSESCFTAECPEIMKLNNNSESGEACYSLKFYSGIDVNTNDLTAILPNLSNTTIIYVSLGNDELNIETAIKLRILFERVGLFPVIRAIVYSDIKHKMLSERHLRNFKNNDYKIEIIGNISSRFSYDSIVNEELEQKALQFHLAWANSPEEIEASTKQFNEYEYFRNSSMSTAIHAKYRSLENISETIATVYEHLRWNAYMRTEGYVYSGSTDKSTRNDRAKMHHDLIKQEGLSEDELNKDKRMVQAQ